MEAIKQIVSYLMDVVVTQQKTIEELSKQLADLKAHAEAPKAN